MPIHSAPSRGLAERLDVVVGERRRVLPVEDGEAECRRSGPGLPASRARRSRRASAGWPGRSPGAAPAPCVQRSCTSCTTGLPASSAACRRGGVRPTAGPERQARDRDSAHAACSAANVSCPGLPEGAPRTHRRNRRRRADQFESTPWIGRGSASPRVARMEGVTRATSRIGTAGWSYPSPPGAWTGIVYPVRQGRAWRGGKFDELSWYAERFDTVEVNSSFYRVPRARRPRAWAARTPAGFEFSVKLFQKLTHPAMFLDRLTQAPEPGTGGDARGASPGSHGTPATPHRCPSSDVDEFRRRSIRWPRAGKLGALLAQFPASFKADARRTRLSRLAARRLSRLPRRRGAAAPELERRRSPDDAGVLNAVEGRVGADRRAEVQRLDPAELPAERHRLLLPAAARPQREGVVDARPRRRIATTTSTRATSSTRSSRSPRRCARW